MTSSLRFSVKGSHESNLMSLKTSVLFVGVTDLSSPGLSGFPDTGSPVSCLPPVLSTVLLSTLVGVCAAPSIDWLKLVRLASLIIA